MINYLFIFVLLSTLGSGCSWQHKNDKGAGENADQAATRKEQELNRKRDTTTFTCKELNFKSGDSCEKYEELKKCLREITLNHCPADQKITEVHCKSSDPNCNGVPLTVFCTYSCPQVDNTPGMTTEDTEHEESMAFALTSRVAEVDSIDGVCKAKVPSGYYRCGTERKPKDEVIEQSPVKIEKQEEQNNGNKEL